ncbi:hypothetical protein GS682_04740 [Nostoc sp. B(2019)]|nr:hypothetical protein [Nostoc sp. B(2019)]
MTLKIKDADGQIKHVATTGTGTLDDPIKTQQTVEVTAMPSMAVTVDEVTIGAALPAGNNNIGNIDIASLPVAMVTGDRLKVDTPAIRALASSTDSVAATQSGTWTVGLTSGSNNIGDVDIASFPSAMVATDKLKVEATATEFDIRDLSSASDSVASVQSGIWNVAVNNFPASFQVSNLPATQTVAGSVNVSNFPSDFQISNLPTTLGAKTAAASLPVTLSTDGAFATNFGLQADAVATSDTDAVSFLSLFKRLLQRVTTLIGSVGLDLTLQSIRDRLMPAGTTAAYIGTSAGANLKTSAGSIHAITCSNNNSSIRYFQIFNQTTSPVLNDVPVRSFPVYANDGLLIIGQDVIGGSGISLNTGIAWGFSTTRLTYTAGTAADCIATVRWA